MSLLLLLFLPVVIGLFGLIFSKGFITWKEFLVLEGAIIVVISTGFLIGKYSRNSDVEIWNGVIVSKQKVPMGCCHSYPCNCHEVCSGSGSDRSCSRECDTCYQHTHDEKYVAKTSNDEIAYEDGCNAPGSPEPKRFTEIIMGEPTAIEHTYQNYIKGSKDTLFKRDGALDKFKDQIPEYPRVFDLYRNNRFIFQGLSDSKQKEWNERLSVLNGSLGKQKQVNMIVVVTKESDQAYVEALNQAWLGGKKNDYIIVIGAPEYPKISWVAVLSWSKSEDAKVVTRDRILELENFDGEKIVNIIGEEVNTKYVRREMKDFEYLKASLEPSKGVQIFLFILGLVVSIGLTIFFWVEDPFETK